MAINPPPIPLLNSYSLNLIEDIWLTTAEQVPNNDHLYIRQILQKIFLVGHFQMDHPSKTQQFYEFILVDTKSLDITHNRDADFRITHSKCTIRNILGTSQWKDPFEDKTFTKSFQPQHYNYIDYRMAWFKAFLLYPDRHSWFFNFHDNCPKDFPIWFYQWWLSFGGSTKVLPQAAAEGWKLWATEARDIKPYQREVQFFRTFNVAWIFGWEYQIYQYLPIPLPMLLVGFYKVKWWEKYNTLLCDADNVAHFSKTGKKKITFFNLKDVTIQKKVACPSQPLPRLKNKQSESSSDSRRTSNKGSNKGLTQK